MLGLPRGSERVGVSVSSPEDPFLGHFQISSHRYLCFSTYQRYEEKEGAQTDRHMSLAMSVSFFNKARRKKTDQALFFLVRRRDNFLVMIQRCHMESVTVLYAPHSFAFKTLLVTAHLSR